MATIRAGLMATTAACPFQRERRLRERRVCLVPPRASANDGPKKLFSVDRRDVLLGLGGAAAAVISPGGVILPAAMADPVAPPELMKCHPATAGVPNNVPMACCPPYTSANVVPYDFPRTALRVRRPAHEVKDDKEYLAKYELAIQKMKDLKEDHPWNFYQQALIHCAYCNGGYDQANFPGVPLQVHNSWLFLPWHRYYLHFFERILGKLIGDDTFALPFWNFDSEEGMSTPEIFTRDTQSPLYNENRETTHYHPVILDYKFKYSNTTPGATGEDLVQANYSYIQSMYKNNLQLPDSFIGHPALAGKNPEGPGALETLHNSIHQWVGPIAAPHTDMGNFATAAKDCMFYCLHANVDRMWQVYRNFRGQRVEFNDRDWLDASFIFYDEHERVVSVKVADALNPVKLRYTYEEVPLPWMGTLKVTKAKETTGKAEINLTPVSEFGPQPRALVGTTPLRVLVPRPKRNRNKKEKDEHVELLRIKDIQVATQGPTRFDVYVAAPYGELAGPDFGEFAGSYVKLPHNMASENKGDKKHKAKTMNLNLGITALLEDIEAESAEKVVVTIVPSDGNVTVGGIEIKLIKADTPRLA